MQPWARLDIGSHQRSRWQRLRYWIFGNPHSVHVTTEIASGVVHGVVEDFHTARHAIRH